MLQYPKPAADGGDDEGGVGLQQASSKLVLHVFPSFAVGGAQVRFAMLANRFGSEWSHLVASLDGNTGCRERLDPKLDLRFLDVPRSDGRPFAAIRTAAGILQRLRPALLVTSNWGSMGWVFANLLRGVPHIHTEDGFGSEERYRQLRRRVLARRLALRRSQIVVPSQTLLRLAAEQWRLPPAHLHYIPNGIDLDRFFKTTAFAAREGPPVIGVMAALRPEKNIRRLLRAFRLLQQPAQLLVAGDGQERGDLEQVVTSLGLGEQVRFLGHVADQAAFYRSLDLLVLTSDTEQMPLCILEAMAAALPVVATDVGDVRSMVSAENASFVTPADDRRLAEAMDRLLSDSALRRQVGDANRRRAEHWFDQERMFQRYRALFNVTAATGGPAPCAA